MTPKCRILCPTFGGHITLPKSRLLLCDVGGAVLLAAPFVSLLYPISGALSIASRRCGRTILQKAAGGRLRHIGLGLVCRKPWRDFELYPSGGPFLVPPRSSPPEAPSRKSRQGFRPNPSVSATPSQLPFQGSLFRT